MLSFFLFTAHPAYRGNDKTMRDAACKGMTTEFFATPGEISRRVMLGDYSQAKALCKSCPVRTECGDEAIYYHDFHTVRAGFALWIKSEHRALAKEVEARQRARQKIRQFEYRQ